MKTINIKGKEYVMVNERILEFRNKYPNWSLESEIVAFTNDSVTIKAIVKDENGVVRATGFANEDKEASMINKTSYVENCETSAWGRALGCLGIGIESSIASAEEVKMAIKKQEIEQTPVEQRCANCGCEITEKVAKYSKNKFGVELCYDCQKKAKEEPIPEIEV